MANIKSAKKRIKVIAKKTLRNKIIKSGAKTAIKKVSAVLQTGRRDESETVLRNAISLIDKAVSKGVYHKNTAARKKSQLARMVNQAKA